jgi:hypothetical protein
LGFLLDNEYKQSPISQEYFAELEDEYRAANIAVPLTYNDPGEGQDFINGTVRTLFHFDCSMFNE